MFSGLIDTRLLLTGLCIGVLSLYAPDGLTDWLPTRAGGIELPRGSWLGNFAKLQHSVPIFDGGEDVEQQPPPVQAMSPRHQRALKEEEDKVAAREEARVHAPVYFLASEGTKNDKAAIDRIARELSEHVKPLALFVIVAADDATTVQIASTASLPFKTDDVFAALRETDVAVKWTEKERTTAFESFRSLRPSLLLTVPSSIDHRQAVAVGTALHRFREQHVAFLVQAPRLTAPLAKIIDATTHYTSSDRHRTVSAYGSPLLSLATGAADEAEGEALLYSSDALPQRPFLLRFGHVYDHGDEIL